MELAGTGCLIQPIPLLPTSAKRNTDSIPPFRAPTRCSLFRRRRTRLVLLWTVIFARLSVEKEATYREAMASAAILSAALEQHTVKAIHQVDQITRSSNSSSRKRRIISISPARSKKASCKARRSCRCR